MADVLGFVLVGAFFASALCGLAWLSARARRRGIAGSLLGIADEIWHPVAHEPRIQVERQAESLAPLAGADELLRSAAATQRTDRPGDHQQ